MAGEFRGRVGVNALWPRTVIDTSAVRNLLGGEAVASGGRTPEIMADAADQLRTTELARAREVWRKKFGQVPVDAADKARQMRFLAGRGFGAETVRRVLAGGDDEDA